MKITAWSIQLAFSVNAFFSALTSILLSFFPLASSDVLSFDYPNILRLTGIFLLFHAIILMWVRNRTSVHKWVKINLGVIAPYQFVILALITLGYISGTIGVALASIDGVVVGLIAIWQYQKLE